MSIYFSEKMVEDFEISTAISLVFGLRNVTTNGSVIKLSSGCTIKAYKIYKTTIL